MTTHADLDGELLTPQQRARRSLVHIVKRAARRFAGRWRRGEKRDSEDAQKAEKVQAALFRIAQLSRDAESLDALYAAIHRVVDELMNAANFYVAQYDAKKDWLTFPYFVDEVDKADQTELTIGMHPGHGLTAYVIRTGQPLLATPEVFDQLEAAGEIELIGVPSVDWLGVPLKTGDQIWGAIVTQTYNEQTRYSDRDKELFVFIAQHIASAIEQKRKEEALRQSETRYRQMFENTRAIQLLVDPEDGAIVDANVAACDYYGYTRDALRSMRLWDINVLGRDAVLEEMRRALDQHQGYFVFRHMRASGEIRDVEVHSGPIEVAGRVLLYSIVHDVTERRRAEQAVLESERKYRNIFDFAAVGIYQSTRDGRLITANQMLAKMLGYDSIDELLTKNLPEDIYLTRQEREEYIARYDAAAGNAEVLWRRRDGTPIFVQLSCHTITTPEGTSFYEGFVYDVSDRKQTEQTLRKQAAAIRASMDGVGIFDERLELTFANDSLSKLFGYGTASALVGRSICDLYDPQEQVRFITSIVPVVQQRGRWRGEATGLRRDGSSFPQEISLTAIEDGGIVCVVRDVTERTYAEEQIKHLAYHDALTNLPNRLLLKDRLSVALSHAHRERTRLAVLFLDLDRFKIINDSLGHNTGDQLLQAVAARLQTCIRESDTVARLGGDEFTVLLPHLPSTDTAGPVAQKIIEAIRHPFHIDGREIFTSTSIGIALYPEDGSDAETLIKNADTAMYQAKEFGRDNYQLFNAHVNAKALQRIALEQGLRKALANDEFQMHYQPIVDIKTGRVTGNEALIRWNHPQLGAVAPATFIPIAEATGMMIPIGTWTLRTAARQARAWHDAGHHALSLAVNLSVTQLQQPDLTKQVLTILEETGLPPRMLELEITESTAMHNPELSVRTLYELKRMGIRISLDDFGTGHSSLSYLKRFPIDTLKIDQSFVRDIVVDPDTAAIVTAIIVMAHSLRLRVIAEGVELQEQADFLRRHDCDLMQGFLVKEPVPAEGFSAFLRGR
ncbi:MAG: EAL domain-containing protein [Thermoanaerobaculia bacterium]